MIRVYCHCGEVLRPSADIHAERLYLSAKCLRCDGAGPWHRQAFDIDLALVIDPGADGGMTVIETLQSLLDHDYELTGFCGSSTCGYHSPLVTEDLIETFGPDFSFIAGKRRIEAFLQCPQCGHKGCETRLSKADVPTPAGGHNRSV